MDATHVFDQLSKRPGLGDDLYRGKANGYHKRHNGRNGSNNSYRHHQHQQQSNGEPRKARYKEKLERESRQLAEDSFTVKSFIPFLGFDLRAANQNYAHNCLGLHYCCSRCVPSGKMKFVSSDQIGAPLRNILLLPRLSSKGVLGSLCPTLWWTVSKPLVSPFADPREPSKISQRVRSAIQESAISVSHEKGIDIELSTLHQTKRADQIITKMSGSIYGWLLKLSNYTLHWVFWKLFRKLQVQGSHVDMLLQAQEKNVPILFLPSHKSHLDYILITFVLINIGIKAPHIAAGDNLNIPIFNWLIRHLGGWFIRRKLDNGRGGRDELYRSCLHEYMEQLLKTNQNIEFYIEGSRSRTGKPALPKGGLLSVLVEAIREGVVPDILIAPTSITYDRILERNFIRHELMGGNKKPENFFKGLRGVWSMLTMNIGCVRMDFAQPFSLKDYLFTHQISKYSLMDLSQQLPVQNSPDSKSAADRRLVNALGYHIVYDFNCCAPIMSTNIVGFLLMTKFRNGVMFPDLVHSYVWLVNKIVSWGRPTGFSGLPTEAVSYALAYLSHLLLVKTVPVDKGEGTTTTQFITPRLDLPDVFELLHHTNQVSLGFVKEAFVACSIAVLVENESNSESIEKKSIQVLQANLADQVLSFAKIFAREFVYSPPCVDIVTSLFDGIETLKRIEVVRDIQSRGIKRFAGRTSFEEDWEEESDEEGDQILEVSHSLEARDHLHFLRCVLGPYMECYWNCAMYIHTAAEKGDLSHFNESDLLHQLQHAIGDKASDGSLYFIESCSSDIIRNAIRSYVGMEVISTDKNGLLCIKDQSKLDEIIDTLSMCKL